MGPLARLLASQGHRVTGSDQSELTDVKRFEECGIRVQHCHSVDNIADAELLIRSAAVPEDNPEVGAALASTVPVLKYSEALGRLMQNRQGVAVAGTHGKTTVTALLAHLLRGVGLAPGWIVGGDPLTLPDAAGWGHGKPFIVEACEFDRSFLNLHYDIAVVTNVGCDHMDYFGDLEGVHEAFYQFARGVAPGGVLVLGRGVRDTMDWPTPPDGRILEVGKDLSVDIGSSQGGVAEGVAHTSDGDKAAYQLSLLGAHSVDNLAVALLVATAVGAPLRELTREVSNFNGVARRLQDLGEQPLSQFDKSGSYRLIDDFAHHPDALEAAESALRARFPGRRLVAVFQPHQVSRTEEAFDGFCSILGRFDEVLLCDIFVARDAHPERADSVLHRLDERVGPQSQCVGPAWNAAQAVGSVLMDGDICLVMGAGDIDGLAGNLARAD